MKEKRKKERKKKERKEKKRKEKKRKEKKVISMRKIFSGLCVRACVWASVHYIRHGSLYLLVAVETLVACTFYV